MRRFSAVLAAGVLTIPGLVTVSCGESTPAPEQKEPVPTPESDWDNRVFITMDEIKANFAKYYEPYPGGGGKVKDKAFFREEYRNRLPRDFALDPETRAIGDDAFKGCGFYIGFALPPKLEVIGGGRFMENQFETKRLFCPRQSKKLVTGLLRNGGKSFRYQQHLN